MTKIESAVSHTAGVEKVQVLFNASKVKADFDDSQVSADELAQVVDKLGYEVKKIKVKDQVTA
ncbi:hypothetical protein FD14_GL000416 [Secundilactobacillus similis DSM 23365 = JCM 2765]|jgi:copper chaperone CopZ|uniref:HMA domain-containing protein n=2 Tax=Secundilactobacillus similis TaxID=414682 RepID=A0A0R2FL95_9LACO|nr:hypothetical protein FD14_GL000416 [Secundilactobacillus similis DSM 23365 = JCM 2765]